MLLLLLLLVGCATVKEEEGADDDKVVNVAALDVVKILPLPTVLVHCWSDRDDARQKIDRVAMMSLFDFF
jgi:hypothetical protein